MFLFCAHQISLSHQPFIELQHRMKAVWSNVGQWVTLDSPAADTMVVDPKSNQVIKLLSIANPGEKLVDIQRNLVASCCMYLYR